MNFHTAHFILATSKVFSRYTWLLATILDGIGSEEEIYKAVHNKWGQGKIIKLRPRGGKNVRISNVPSKG